MKFISCMLLLLNFVINDLSSKENPSSKTNCFTAEYSEYDHFKRTLKKTPHKRKKIKKKNKNVTHHFPSSYYADLNHGHSSFFLDDAIVAVDQHHPADDQHNDHNNQHNDHNDHHNSYHNGDNANDYSGNNADTYSNSSNGGIHTHVRIEPLDGNLLEMVLAGDNENDVFLEDDGMMIGFTAANIFRANPKKWAQKIEKAYNHHKFRKCLCYTYVYQKILWSRGPLPFEVGKINKHEHKFIHSYRSACKKHLKNSSCCSKS